MQRKSSVRSSASKENEVGEYEYEKLARTGRNLTI